MQLDGLGADFVRSLDLFHLRVDEQARHDAPIPTARDRFPNAGAFARHIEPTLGRALFPALRNEGDLLRPEPHRDRNDLCSEGSFEIQSSSNRLAQKRDISILNVATVFAQMDRDAVRSAQLGEDRCPHWVRLAPSARLANRGDMIDVDA
jgi:hypothetical protein